ncbi:MAG: Hsp20/alpha crystallin family protein [Armatimonadetes bacterium]|nr:Hsp20/alpha crystallin family protein [Armatimonadota bacterium]
MALPILRRGGSAVPVRRGDSNTQSSPINRVDPWNDLAVMDRLFDTFFSTPQSLFGRGMTSAAQPSVELYETADDLLAYVYAPGMAQDSFDIFASGDSITIKGERKPLLEVTEGLTSHTPWAGLATGTSTFNASYSLPVEIDPAKVEANYKDGVLHLRMPKSEAAKPRQVKVEVGRS